MKASKYKKAQDPPAIKRLPDLLFISPTIPKQTWTLTGTYLQQEIVAEGATRNVPAFSRFLHVAALCNATVVNYTKCQPGRPGAAGRGGTGAPLPPFPRCPMGPRIHAVG